MQRLCTRLCEVSFDPPSIADRQMLQGRWQDRLVTEGAPQLGVRVASDKVYT